MAKTQRSTSRPQRSKPCCVADVAGVLGRLAPLDLAQDWDNVGLLAGDPRAAARRVLLAIDLTPVVVTEARSGRFDFVVAYHPPIFKPIARLNAASRGTDAAVFACIAAGIAIYSVHTALDAAEGGTNDVLADLAGLPEAVPLEWTAPRSSQVKLVVFIPHAAVDRVSEALYAAGAGRIGAYERCGYHLHGEGTFFGTDSTNPAVGQKGVFERVAETRLETVCPKARLAEVIAALRRTHPYEEPAFDIYPLETAPRVGIGRVGRLRSPTTLGKLAARLTKGCRSNCTQIVGQPASPVERLIIVAGAAGSLPIQAGLAPGDAVITGEMRHHDALSTGRAGAGAVILGHWYSERPVLNSLRGRIARALPGVEVVVSERDFSPLAVV